jgi:hypothetical protein
VPSPGFGIEVPPGRLWVVRNVSIYRGLSLPTEAEFKLFGNGGAVFLAGTTLAASLGFVSWEGRAAIHAGQELGVGVDHDMTVYITGYDFAGE